MVLKANGIQLPAPVKIVVNDEIIWSSDTGRSSDGTMLGDVIANKKNITIEWGVLKASEVKIISTNMKAGFFSFVFEDEGEQISITGYRATLSKEQIGKLGDGIFYYRTVTTSFIQK